MATEHAPVPGTERFTNVAAAGGDVRIAECRCDDEDCYHVQTAPAVWTRHRGPRD